ncbi:hypothetical protein [Sulfobacillus harzensis]|uniref:Nucleoside phosphorylase n=1 Tax=Sulfobacillus harzensis TaxID=2729629 RepID=A0A7Y0L7N7_9FIRM|nr:hypothetical protein [Sulfobacillus harzensis]NMP24487.1 nucleoside phosphorylase [Sulfobacillus harzensis]
MLDLSSDDVWRWYRLLHDAQLPTADLVVQLDAEWRERLIMTWLRESASQLIELGVRRVIVVGSGGSLHSFAKRGDAATAIAAIVVHGWQHFREPSSKRHSCSQYSKPEDSLWQVSPSRGCFLHRCWPTSDVDGIGLSQRLPILWEVMADDAVGSPKGSWSPTTVYTNP